MANLQQVREYLYGHEPKKALDSLLSRSSSHYSIYNTWKRLRSSVIRDSKLRTEDYERHLESCIKLAHQKDPLGHDYHALKSLLESQSFPVYHNMYESILKYGEETTMLNDPDVIDLYLSVAPMHDTFYEFELPQDVREAAMEQRDQQRMDKYNISEETTMSHEELELIKNEAVMFLQQGYLSKKKNGTRFIEALLIVSGRRVKEIMSTLTLHGKGPTEYSAMVTGLCKQRATPDTPDNVTTDPLLIPLLVPYDLFEASLQDMRKNETEFSNPENHGNAFKKLARRMGRVVWGENRILKHADRRCLYSELAFRYRNQHKCYEGMNQRLFTGTVLGHTLRPQLTDMYLHYTFT